MAQTVRGPGEQHRIACAVELAMIGGSHQFAGRETQLSVGLQSLQEYFEIARSQLHVIVQQQDIRRRYGGHATIDGVGSALIDGKLNSYGVARKRIGEDGINPRFILNNDNLPKFRRQGLLLH